MISPALRAGSPRVQPSFAAPVSSVARSAAPQRAAAVPQSAPAQSPWAFRGSPDSEIGRAVQSMVDRARQCGTKLGGESVEQMLTKAILSNRKISNEKLLEMSRVPLEKLSDSPEDQAEIERRVPGSRKLDSHQFTVGLLSAITGIDPKKLSQAAPGLGVTGAPGTPILFAPPWTGLKRSTALHDTTDYFRGAGVKGVNKAVWGVENRILSALKSLGGVPY
ncbi:MAG TPA: hypothetical protein VFA20_06665 [Myxococcaceae bacterium]|nr:hypothetical protein [Myxococcaceae bacterium]